MYLLVEQLPLVQDTYMMSSLTYTYIMSALTYTYMMSALTCYQHSPTHFHHSVTVSSWLWLALDTQIDPWGKYQQTPKI